MTSILTTESRGFDAVGRNKYVRQFKRTFEKYAETEQEKIVGE
jgi:hypothetical protein